MTVLKTIASGSPRTRCALLMVLAAAFSAASTTCTSQKQLQRQDHPRLTSSSFVALAVLPPASASQDGPWVRFEAPDGDFSVAMPHVPAQTGDSVSTPIGAQPVTRFKVSAGGCDFDAGYLQRSENVLARLVSEQTILRSACEGTASHMGGRVASSMPLSLEGSAGREIEIQLAGDDRSAATARIVITKERIYHAIVRVPANASSQQATAARRFLESFHLAATPMAAAN